MPKIRVSASFDAWMLRRTQGLPSQSGPRFRTGIGFLLISLLMLGSSGCAIDYFDARNGIEHVWGIGHLAMKVGSPNEGLKAVGQRTDTLGLSIGKAQEGYHLELGWSSYQQIDVVESKYTIVRSLAGRFLIQRQGRFRIPTRYLQMWT